LHHFTFEYPYVFVLLLLIICIYKCPYALKEHIFPHLHLFTRFTSWFNREKLLYSLIFSLLITALASPISYDTKLANHRKGRDLVFVLDTSGSMGESAYSEEHPHASKFTILKNVIKNFITHRFDDNVGVVVFGTYAYASVPLTYDMHAVAFLLDFLEVGIAGENTAIGDGLAQATALLQKGAAKNKVILLVTDGYQNSGATSIKQAVQKAKKLHIKIYTIGLGKKSDFDAALLQKIAKETSAKMFTAANAATLQNVYKELDTLEPSQIRSQNYLNKHMLFTYPLSFAILLLLYILTKKREF
jgi:Ca-activated chloride channel family protein